MHPCVHVYVSIHMPVIHTQMYKHTHTIYAYTNTKKIHTYTYNIHKQVEDTCALKIQAEGLIMHSIALTSDMTRLVAGGQVCDIPHYVGGQVRIM